MPNFQFSLLIIRLFEVIKKTWDDKKLFSKLKYLFIAITNWYLHLTYSKLQLNEVQD